MNAPLRALIFDSHYDSYKGVVAYVRLLDGKISPTDILLLMASGVELKPVEVGIFSPSLRPNDGLSAGEVGYVATGLKTVREARVGDTITLASRPAAKRCLAIVRSNQWCLPEFIRLKARITPI